ncbi:hypothetical protein ABTZ78_09095 [Streptomyces bauhiniae]|uniref:hypothetical protein n=1 Tax=Streptomyces bauhiniae TaxID=2340725 RepID=UPI003327425E
MADVGSVETALGAGLTRVGGVAWVLSARLLFAGGAVSDLWSSPWERGVGELRGLHDGSEGACRG